MKKSAALAIKPWTSLRKNGEFQAIYKSGSRFFTKNLGIFAKEHTPDSPPRLGYVASAAKVGNAVKRNRAKRRLRALARKCLTNCAPSTHDYVLVATNSTNACDFDVLEKDLQTALRRLKLSV
ncbi:MAG: ribonuclease P protein component [Alphaproteobacteria bacterium]|nr:MAG: ribonuclease P protein component [Alphaproteobacteria bacterium]